MMGKFKIGDRVRRIRFKNGTIAIGDTGVVDSICHNGDVYVKMDKTGDLEYNISDYLELVEPKWEPKVGDRVVVVNNITPGGEPISQYVVGNEYEVTDICKDSHGNHAVKLLGHYQYLRLNQISKPTGLIIQAGKFYKTRDGRKVGPAKLSARPSELCKWSVGTLWLYQDNGTAGDKQAPNCDLIAEWVDGPVDKAPKFKVGDRIRHKSLGHTGFIEAIRDGDCYKTFWENVGWGATDPASDIELVAPSTAIVALIENGIPKPSETPKIHDDQSSATTEAERLASLHKGKKFGVFVLADTREEPLPSYEHEWKNLAVRGKKIDAIKELRSLTGMQLKSAKDVVEHFLDAA